LVQGASDPTAGGAAAISRLDGDEPDDDQSFNGSYREAIEELDNDNEHWKDIGISHAYIRGEAAAAGGARRVGFASYRPAKVAFSARVFLRPV
jgi:hypothetical protein